MPIEELRTLACRPSRLETLMLHKEHLELLATEIYPIYSLLNDTAEISPSRFDAVLLPGSRWLLDFAEDMNSSMIILCWDLFSCSEDGTCSPTAEYLPRVHSVLSWTQQLASDEASVLLLINGTDEYDNW